MTDETLNHLSPAESARRTQKRTPLVAAEERLHGAVPPSRRYYHDPPLGWALSRGAAFATDKYARRAYEAFSNPGPDHPYDYEQDLVAKLNAVPAAAARP